ncbi:hypothetical protein ACFE04_001489 [Oxalis oulophora]
MTITPKISINDGNLVVHGKTILKGVPDNIVLTAGGSGGGLVSGSFIGATFSDSKSLHVFPLGVLEGLRFMCCFRFKLWWMTQRMGKYGKDIPLETQFLLVESKEGAEGADPEYSETVYTVFLPLLEGPFRAVLQGNDKNEMEICLESGDKAVETNQALHLLYMHAGTNPYEVINQAVKAVEKHMQTFLHRERKKLPSFLDWFGWCTWDAFYTDVTAEGVEEGLKSLSKGGAPPRFLIIDDGWQQIESKDKDPNAVVQEGAQFASRLTGIKENAKFQKNDKNNEPVSGLKHLVDDAKKCHNVNYHQALEASIARNFPDNGCISCMCHNTDSGCAIYVSDKPGNHNFELLRKLVLPDGSVLRAKLPGRPTRDCLFADPARDGTSLLKMWNMNKCAGVVGVFNCQGAGWCKFEKKTRIHDEAPGTLTGHVRASDVDVLSQVAAEGWNGDAIVFAQKSGEVIRLPKGASVPVTLRLLEYELFHFCPVKEISANIAFAPIGLLDMFNSGGAVEEVEVRLEKEPELFDGEVTSEQTTTVLSNNRSPTATIALKVRGCGRFGAYSSQLPLKCRVGDTEADFNYDTETGLVTFRLPVPEEEMYRWPVEVVV